MGNIESKARKLRRQQEKAEKRRQKEVRRTRRKHSDPIGAAGNETSVRR